jgi:uncharacterized peroxidase-related enzyme
MHLPLVEAFDAPGPRGDAIRAMRAAGAPVPQIFHLFAFKQDRTAFLEELTQGVMRGPSPLTPGERELIAAFTSRRNQCLFSTGSHAAVAAELLGDEALVKAVLEDHRAAPIDDKRKALFSFIEKMNRESTAITRADVEALERAGWSEEAIYDAITVCALFNFYNKWIDATGVQDMSPEAYARTGVRLATDGYGMKRRA